MGLWNVWYWKTHELSTVEPREVKLLGSSTSEHLGRSPPWYFLFCSNTQLCNPVVYSSPQTFLEIQWNHHFPSWKLFSELPQKPSEITGNGWVILCLPLVPELSFQNIFLTLELLLYSLQKELVIMTRCHMYRKDSVCFKIPNMPDWWIAQIIKSLSSWRNWVKLICTGLNMYRNYFLEESAFQKRCSLCACVCMGVRMCTHVMVSVKTEYDL